MVTQIVMAERTSLKINVRLKAEHVSEICLLVTTAIVFHEFTFAMGTMIVLIIRMKVKIDNVRLANVILKRNSPVKRIVNGVELFVSKKTGFVMEIQTVLTEPTRDKMEV